MGVGLDVSVMGSLTTGVGVMDEVAVAVGLEVLVVAVERGGVGEALAWLMGVGANPNAAARAPNARASLSEAPSAIDL
jgi:hypothetical protein